MSSCRSAVSYKTTFFFFLQYKTNGNTCSIDDLSGSKTVFTFNDMQVLKVDGAYVAVKFPGTSSSMNNQNTTAPPDSDPSSLLQDCRLLRIDELQVILWSLQLLVGIPDC